MGPEDFRFWSFDFRPELRFAVVKLWQRKSGAVGWEKTAAMEY